MRKIRLKILLGLLTALIAVTLFGCGGSGTSSSGTQISDMDAHRMSVTANGIRLAVLVPDDVDLEDPRVTIWADAAWEEGFRLTFITDSEFLALGDDAQSQYPGIILPDMIHQKADDNLIQSLTAYASAGGWLMLAYDFGVLNPSGFYVAPKSRLGSLAGIDYSYYEALRDQTIGLGPVSGTSDLLRMIQVPPGKSMPVSTTNIIVTENMQMDQAGRMGHRSFLPPSISDPGGLRKYRHASQFEAKLTKGGSSVSPDSSTTEEAISGYGFGVLTYPSFVTADAANYQGTVLLKSTYGYDEASGSMTSSGVAAGLRNEGNGGVLYVNMPVSYLKGQTDGMLMHGLLRYFGASLLKLPRLSDHPDGRGGLVFNWHVDSGAALEGIQILHSIGVWYEGPFSIHLTAGPDTIQVGDGIGLNVPENRITQGWIRYLQYKDHEIGSHGGWDHDVYGLNATEFNADEYVPGSTTLKYRDCLVLNRQAIQNVTRRNETEYSAPMGNNPIWAMDWLASKGTVAYYFAGDTGMGPTRAYRPPAINLGVGYMLHPTMWAFPVSPFGKNATFEDFQENGVSETEITNWYNSLMDFVVKNRTSRLIYAHPPGASDYLGVMKSLMLRARMLSYYDKFRWYTMTDLARFGAKRLKVRWAETEKDGRRVFEANHPESLKSFTWILPKVAYSMPQVVDGRASVSGDAENWIVTARGGNTLKFYSKRP